MLSVITQPTVICDSTNLDFVFIFINEQQVTACMLEGFVVVSKKIHTCILSQCLGDPVKEWIVEKRKKKPPSQLSKQPFSLIISCS
jgi:hypothetical protein